MNRNDRRLLTRVSLKNYKSIRACDISPAQLSFLVGRNGSGKSNFLDSLHFLADALRFSIDLALCKRGGFDEVRRRSGGHPTHIGFRVEFDLEESHGHYAFAVGATSLGGYTVQREECYLVERSIERVHFFRVENGSVRESTLYPPPAAAADRLYLGNVKGVEAFHSVYEALSHTGVYNLNPEAIRNLQPPDPGELLKPDGSNIASVLFTLGKRWPDSKSSIEEYLGKVVPGVVGIERRSVGSRETVEFRQQVSGSQDLRRFWASTMSDGVLRAVGVLTAIFQGAGNRGSSRRCIGIEEPQYGLHPATTGVLIDALRDAGEHSQILVASNSSDLLDNEGISADSIIAVVAEQGESRIGPLDSFGSSVLRDHLYTAGELLRLDQVEPDSNLANVQPNQIRLFGPQA